MIWVLLAIALFLIALNVSETFREPDECGTVPVGQACSPVVERPFLSKDSYSEWQSKIDAEAPIGGNDEDYVRVLQNFYDKVYVPASTKPTETDVESFLASETTPGIDKTTLRRIIIAGFRIDRSGSAAAREEKQVKFTPSKALQPKDGVDEVFVRTEETYKPADTSIGELPEGNYAPVAQQDEPRRSGEFKEKPSSWTGASFYSVCEGEACSKNVL